MQQLSLLRVLLLPSIFSMMIALLITSLLLGLGVWSYFTQNPLFYDYFFGQQGLVTILQNAPDGPTAFLDALLAKTATYNIAVLLVAAGVGFSLYIGLQVFERFIAGTAGAFDAIHSSSGQARMTIEIEVGARAAIRVVTFVLWIVYWFFFTKIVLPYCVILTQIGADELNNWTGWGYGIAAFGLLLASLHLHVIFLRLFMLRPRIFGGQNDINAALLE